MVATAASANAIEVARHRQILLELLTEASEKAREGGYYKIETHTATTTGARYVARIEQRGDPVGTAAECRNCGVWFIWCSKVTSFRRRLAGGELRRSAEIIECRASYRRRLDF